MNFRTPGILGTIEHGGAGGTDSQGTDPENTKFRGRSSVNQSPPIGSSRVHFAAKDLCRHTASLETKKVSKGPATG